MKALTVQQPWAWAIVHGGKGVENRTSMWSYRGPLAIHAGKRWSERGARSPLIHEAGSRVIGGLFLSDLEVFGAIIGVVDLVDIHVAAVGCCESEWAEREYEEHPTGKKRRDITHLMLENPRAVQPIECPGKLGLWNVPADIERALT